MSPRVGGPSGIDSGGGDAGPPLPPGDDDEKEMGLIEMCAQALAEFGNLSIEDVYAVLCEEKGFVHLTRGDLEAPYAEAQERRRLSARLANTGGMEAEEPLLPEGVEVGGVCLATLWSDGVPQRFKAVLDCVRSSTDDAPLFVELVATEGGAPFETAWVEGGRGLDSWRRRCRSLLCTAVGAPLHPRVPSPGRGVGLGAAREAPGRGSATRLCPGAARRTFVAGGAA